MCSTALFHFILPVLLCISRSAAQDATIVVGGDASTRGGFLQFIPPSVVAQNGSVITLIFSGSPGNHSVTQTSFNDPCQPLSGGFDSGFVHVPLDTYEGYPTWNLTITNDAISVWFYSAQTVPVLDCPGGMVGSINAPLTGNETFLRFQQDALSLNATQYSLQTPVPSLNGVGANAEAPPGSIAGNITGYGLPSMTITTAPSSTSIKTSNAPTLAPKNGIAVSVIAFFVWMLLRTWSTQYGTLVDILACEVALH